MTKNCAALLMAIGLWQSTTSFALAATGLTSETLKNVTVTVEDMAGGGTHPIKFTNGRFKSDSEDDAILHSAGGDLDGDGIADGAIAFYESFGGSGAFMTMTVFLCKNNKPVQIGSRVLGDRSNVKSLKIKNETLTLDIVTHGPSDPASMPTVHKVIKFHVKNGKLIGPTDIN
jgi:hypothetical protein